jgi:uncharacterized metal-binding protein
MKTITPELSLFQQKAQQFFLTKNKNFNVYEGLYYGFIHQILAKIISSFHKKFNKKTDSNNNIKK